MEFDKGEAIGSNTKEFADELRDGTVKIYWKGRLPDGQYRILKSIYGDKHLQKALVSHGSIDQREYVSAWVTVDWDESKLKEAIIAAITARF